MLSFVNDISNKITMSASPIQASITQHWFQSQKTPCKHRTFTIEANLDTRGGGVEEPLNSSSCLSQTILRDSRQPLPSPDCVRRTMSEVHRYVSSDTASSRSVASVARSYWIFTAWLQLPGTLPALHLQPVLTLSHPLTMH